MLSLEDSLKQRGTKLSVIAREIGVSLQDLSHFIRRETDRVGRAKRKAIRAWLVREGYLEPPRERAVCVCPLCQGRHVMKKNATSGSASSSSDKE